jgi:HK97 family phage major capsid protein
MKEEHIMNQILTLREKRAAAWEKAKSFLDACRDENGLVSPENAAQYDAMEAEIISQGKEIDRLERQAAIDAEMNAPTHAPITNKPQTASGELKTGRASDEYKRAFTDALRGRPVTNLLQESVDDSGGFIVPLEFERSLVAGLQENNVIRTLAKTITTAADRKVSIAAAPSTATWVGEAAAIPESTVTFGQKILDAHKLTDLIKVSTELLQDAMFDLEAYLTAEFARAFGAAEEQSFCTGTGVGQPTGIFTENGGHLGVTTAGQTAITFDDLIALVYALKSPYRRNACFLTNDATVGALRKLKDSNAQYLWSVGLTQGQPDRLLGFPLYTSPYAPTIAAGAYSVAFGDFANFWIADRAGRTVQRLNELYAGGGQIGYLAMERVDGKVILSEGIQLLKQAGG